MKVQALDLKIIFCLFTLIAIPLLAISTCFAISDQVVAVNTDSENMEDLIHDMDTGNDAVHPELEDAVNENDERPWPSEEAPGLEDPINPEDEYDPGLESDPEVEDPMDNEEYPDLPATEDEYNDEEAPDDDFEQQIEDTLDSDSYDS